MHASAAYLEGLSDGLESIMWKDETQRWSKRYHTRSIPLNIAVSEDFKRLHVVTPADVAHEGEEDEEKE